MCVYVYVGVGCLCGVRVSFLRCYKQLSSVSFHIEFALERPPSVTAIAINHYARAKLQPNERKTKMLEVVRGYKLLRIKRLRSWLLCVYTC